MKQVSFDYKGRSYNVVICLYREGFCDISIYRKRLQKRWWQRTWENICNFTHFPDTIEDIIQIVKTRIDDTLEDETKLSNLIDDFSKLNNDQFSVDSCDK